MDNPIHTRFTLPCLGLRAAAAVLLLLLLLSPAAITPVASHNDHGEHKNYLVIVRSRYEYDKNVHKNVSSWHASLLSSVCDTAKEVLEADPTAISRLIYSYRTVVNGFAARMTPEELDKMSKMEWFDRALPEQTFHLLTTRTPHMLGLMGGRRHGGLWNTSNMGEGVIIGILDDGIYAGHPSFDGAGMQPPPAKWKGRCDFNKTVCNNKLIGARSYFESAKWKWKGLRDPVLPIAEGQHGTHTSSTAAGAFVPNASVFGNGLGTAAGMAPRAHIAFYQVCYEDKGCDRDDILAAVDDAIGDGVDILSLSLGHEDAIDFSDDPVSLAGYTAILNGVFICAAAGNTGPSPSTLVNEAPWLLTVGASTTDRRFLASVKLGDNVQIDGESLNDPNTTMGDLVPLVRDVSDGLCVNGNVLKAQNVSGKIIICEAGGDVSTAKAKMLKGIGVVGMIVVTPELFGPVIIPRPHAIPTVQVSNAAGQKIKAYIHKARGPTATFVFKGAAFNTPRSPMVAPFSSRGPNRRSRGILKPDIIGPGVNLVAIGAGHVNPKKAMDPGLVYNMTAMGYVPYLCGLNYTDDKVSTIIYPEPPVSCAKLSRLEQDDLNYPSITVILNQPPFTAKANRSVTNVGAASSTYTVEVNVPASVTVEVNPPKLTFKALEEVLNYSVTIKSANGQALTGPVEGELKWLSGKYVVRSPILVTNESGPSPAETRKP
uniref:Subtilisin-like protease SBT1.2 n=1 Tax=Zea mays TaxID=4577 RepID=A0A804RLL6_MAIZE